MCSTLYITLDWTSSICLLWKAGKCRNLWCSYWASLKWTAPAALWVSLILAWSSDDLLLILLTMLYFGLWDSSINVLYYWYTRRDHMDFIWLCCMNYWVKFLSLKLASLHKSLIPALIHSCSTKVLELTLWDYEARTNFISMLTN